MPPTIISSNDDDDFGETERWNRTRSEGVFREETVSTDAYHCCYCGKPVGFNHCKAMTVAKCPHCGLTFYCLVEPLYITRSLRQNLRPSDN